MSEPSLSSADAIAPLPRVGIAALEAPLQDPETLAALRSRTLFLLAVLLPAIVLTAVLVISERRTVRSADVAERAIPATIVAGDRVWTSTAMTFSDAEMEILETRDYVFRSYSDGAAGRGAGGEAAAPVDLCVVFSEDNRKGTHPPDVCLEASGYRAISRQDRTLTLDGTELTLRELVTTNAAGDQYMYFAYFYKCGDAFTPSFYDQQVQIIWNGLARKNTAGALIRLSVPMASYSDLPAARARVDELLAATFPYLKENLNAAN